MESNNWNDRYINKELPWDIGIPDPHLTSIIKQLGLKGTSLELGCGTGTDSIWLAKNGFEATGIDLSENAISQAVEKAKNNKNIHFIAADILKIDLLRQYDLIYDRGCFHSFSSSLERQAFCKTVLKHLGDKGKWFSLIGSTDGPPRDVGPPRLSLQELAADIEQTFEILEIISTDFKTKHKKPAKAWACLMQKRIHY